MVGRRGHRAAGALAEAGGRHFPPRGSLLYLKAFYQSDKLFGRKATANLLFQLRPREEVR